ncbi:MAG: SPOR domain-containing protein [Alphaproteobacteria bacterium]|nr:SPOR domain-containing protein [Alphaproteobacteria bacterium]
MDQNSSGGSDKRNWRERLGIGTKDAAIITKDMPKVSDEFKPESPPAAPRAASAVRPAPMAPRAAAAPARPAAAPGSARPAARPAASVAPEALADKLKSQRDAAEKLAEQRVAAAKQRAQASALPPATNGGGEKPKFSFADDDTRPAAAPAPSRPAPPPAQRAVPPSAQRVVPPQQQSNYTNQIAPPRPPLGGNQAMPPRAVPPPQQNYAPQQPYPTAPAYPQGQPYYPQQPPQYPQGYQQQPPQGYAPVPPPGYRPIDPATGYTPPPPFNPQQRPSYPPVGSASGAGPRLQVPQRPPVNSFNNPQSGYAAEPRGNSPRLTNPPPLRPAPAPAQYEGDEDDIFEQPAPRAQRRATADDYNQAYREVGTDYEEEPPRSRGPLILIGVLGLALLAGLLAVWGYTTYIKNGGRATTTVQGNAVPVVPAPDKAAKTTPDAAGSSAAGKVTNTSKKLIYDRIVGDQEVPAGQMVPTEEVPIQPSNNSAPIAPAADGAVPQPAAPATGTGNDGTPLPLPPPPGGINGTQGSLEPSGKTDAAKTDQALIPPAAGASSAAVASPAGSTSVGSAGSEAVAPVAAASKPVETPSAESIADNTIPAEPVVDARKLAAKAAESKRLANSTGTSKSLGSKPVVLVPPSKLALNNAAQPAKQRKSAPALDQAGADVGSLYGDSAIEGAPAVATPAEPVVVQPKKRSILDLFKTNTQVDTPIAPTIPANPVPTAPGAARQAVASAPQAVAPTPSAGTGAFVAQLASFKTRTEATAEYSRLSAKHGQIIKRYAPIIETASVAGSTRYRLNIGPMPSGDVASQFCSSLFAAGERDCLVHRQ